jgi:hypothetical protein
MDEREKARARVGQLVILLRTLEREWREAEPELSALELDDPLHKTWPRWRDLLGAGLAWQERERTTPSTLPTLDVVSASARSIRSSMETRDRVSAEIRAGKLDAWWVNLDVTHLLPIVVQCLGGIATYRCSSSTPI